MPPNYQKIAEQAAKRHGIGNWFVRQIKQESGFDPNAKSYAGARGIAQIVPKYHPDAPPMSDPVGQLDWAAKYMSGLVKKYGNAAQALSVYNSGQPDKYLDPNFSNGQTYNYVKNILGGDGGKPARPGRAPRFRPGTPPLLPSSRVTIKPPSMPDRSAIMTESIGKVAQGWDPRDTLADLGPTLMLSWMDPGTLSVTQVPGRRGTSGTVGPPAGRPGRMFKATGKPVPGRFLSSVGGEHQTAGLEGYLAHDYMAKAGSPAVAPVGGRVIKLSGHDPKGGPAEGVHGPFGWSVYIQGNDGRTYYMTHMGGRNVKVGQKVRAGQRIGSVGNYAKWGGADHIHMGVH